ncbi:MAG: energy transducer TonB [Candidatus Sulfotelmatobacter sp.]
MALRLAASCFFLICVVSFATPQASTPQRVRVSQDVAQGLILKKVNPIYPPTARQARIQGTVILKVQINKSGDVASMQLVSGHPMLASAAIDAVKQWKYKPYLLNGEPVDVETRVMVNFAFSDNPPPEGVVGDMPGGIPPDEQGGIAPSNPGDANHPAVPQRVRVSQGVMAGLVVTKVPPEYPPDAKDHGIQGTVVMRVNVDKEGNVSNIQLISGHPLLAPAAIDAVKQWKYKPYLLNGMPVEIETQIQVNFTLAN